MTKTYIPILNINLKHNYFEESTNIGLKCINTFDSCSYTKEDKSMK